MSGNKRRMVSAVMGWAAVVVVVVVVVVVDMAIGVDEAKGGVQWGGSSKLERCRWRVSRRGYMRNPSR